MDLFSFNSYKELVKYFINKNKNIRGYSTLLAKAANCNKSYLSQVLNSNVHLTQDHVYGLASYWNLSDDETDFFFGLLNFEKAGSSSLKKYYRRKIRELRIRNEKLKRKIKAEVSFSETHQIKYYSSWLYPAIHVIVGIPEYQETESIAKILNIDIKMALSILNDLSNMSLIEEKGNIWRMSKKNLHIPHDSIMSTSGHIN